MFSITDLRCTKLYFPFFEVISIMCQAIQNHQGEQWASEVSQLKALKLHAKFSYLSDNDNIKNDHISRYRFGGRNILHAYFYCTNCFILCIFFIQTNCCFAQQYNDNKVFNLSSD